MSPKREMSDSEHDEDEFMNVELAESGESQHMVDMIDLDAVDFQPFFTNTSGTGVNYHSSDSPEHKMLRLDSLLERERSIADHQSSSSRKAQSCLRVLNSLCPGKRSKPLSSSPSQSLEKEGSYPRRYVTFIGVFGFAMLAAVFHIAQASLFLNTKGVFIAKPTVPGAAKGNGIPKELQTAYRDNSDVPVRKLDTPVYWYVPGSAGTTMIRIMSECFGRVVVSEEEREHETDEPVHVLHTPQGNFSNVNATTPVGPKRAKELGVLSSEKIDTFVTPYLWKANNLLEARHSRGRLFSLFRDPVERLLSQYNFSQRPDQHSKEVPTLEKFASSVPDNVMVRTLVNNMAGPLDETHVNSAKDIVKQKFLVGLLDEREESLRRIQAWFGWKSPETCTNNLMHNEPRVKVDMNSTEYAVLSKANAFDLELYDFAKLVFREQEALFKR